MVQKHINSKNLKGIVTLNKNILADLADLIRLSPTASRLLFLIIAYADSNNSLISTTTTLGKMLGIDKKSAQSAMKTLVKNGYIELYTTEISKKEDIIGVYHDKELYKKSNKRIWKVIGDKYITTLDFSGVYTKLVLNSNIGKCSDTGSGNHILLNIKNNLFYDSRIKNAEIIWEM